LLTCDLCREHVRAVRIAGNEYVDSLLNNLHHYIEENNLNEINIPDISASFSKEVC
jgi:hypothetical protein